MNLLSEPPSAAWPDWAATDPWQELTHTLPPPFICYSTYREMKGKNHKNNKHVNNSAGEQPAPRKSREKSHRAEKVSRDKWDYLGQPDSNCSICKSQHEYATLFPANIMVEGHSSFSVPEAGDFLLVCSLPNGAKFPNNFPGALVSLPCSFMSCYQRWWDLVCEKWGKLIWIRCNWNAVVPRLDELCPRREVSGRNNICEQRHCLLRAVKCGLLRGKLRKQL